MFIELDGDQFPVDDDSPVGRWMQLAGQDLAQVQKMPDAKTEVRMLRDALLDPWNYDLAAAVFEMIPEEEKG